MGRLSFLARRRRAVALVFTVAVAAGLFLLGRARVETAHGAMTSRAAAHFVGSEACAGCHPGEQAAWASSHHRHAMERADGDSVLGDFNDVTFRYYGRETRFTRQGATFLVTTENQQGRAETFKVAYTLGVAPLQQYLVAFDDGRIQALPFAWDARPRAQGGQRWFHLYPDTNVTPADPLFWMRPRQNWNHMCGDCHTTAFSKRFSDATGRFDSRWSELGDGCESCHGAGSAHVEAEQHAGPGPHPALASAGALMNGLHTQAEQLDQCGACHAHRVRLREDASHERMHDTWRPDLLQEGLYFVDGQIKDEVFEIGSFLQSRMASRGVTCSHCHDPHSARLRAEGNALCTQCHDRQIFDGPQHHFHPVDSAGARCVSCHMPTRTYMQVHERRDHRIAVPRPDLSAALGTPNACASCHDARNNAWAAAEIARHRSGRRQGPWGSELLGPVLWSVRHEQPGAAAAVRALLDNPTVAGLSKATALSALGQSAPADAAAVAEPLLRAPEPWLRLGAVEALRAAPDPGRAQLLANHATDASRAVRWAVAPLLGQAGAVPLPPERRGDVTALLADYEGWLTANADRAEALVELAGLRRAAGDAAGARGAFDRALRRDETSIVAMLNDADDLRAGGDDPQAETLLRKACALYPDSADAHFALGMLLVRRNDIEAGVTELGRATALAPNNSQYAYAYGVGLHSTRHDERALATLSEARTRFPDNAPIEAALRALCADGSGAARDRRCP
ncbi:MAG TPA: multiheme c-type cytochrome [Polyangia bacterium]|nr:multiheme c-type cytochrome [Polyangia bacterium]